MSEQQNLEIVRQGYDAFGRGDIPALLDLLDPQVTWVTPGPADLPTAGSRRGHAAVGEFFQSLASLMDVLRMEPREFIAQGDRVVVVGDDEVRVKATGATLTGRWTHLFTVREGKVVAFEEMSDVSPIVAELRGVQTKL